MSKGAPKGRRPVVWILSEHPFEKFIVDDQAPDTEYGSFPNKVAIDQYEGKYNKKPKYILGPFYEKKGGYIKNNRDKKLSVCRDISDIRLRSKQKNAIFNGWRGVATFLEGNDDQAFFVFLRELNSDPNKRKETPNPGTVNIADLEFCDS